MGTVFQIDDYRVRSDHRVRSTHEQRPGTASLQAARAAHAVLAQGLSEIRRSTPKPQVLCLQNLEAGVPANEGGWDFIYSTELLDSLPSIAARQVIKTAVARLRPGGRLLLANRAAGPNSRDEEAMASLAASVPAREIGGQAVFRDHAGFNVFLELDRSWACCPGTAAYGTRPSQLPPAC